MFDLKNIIQTEEQAPNSLFSLRLNQNRWAWQIALTFLSGALLAYLFAGLAALSMLGLAWVWSVAGPVNSMLFAGIIMMVALFVIWRTPDREDQEIN